MRWSRTTEVLWRRTPAHVVALPPDAPDPLILAGTARDAWDALAEPRSTEELHGLLGSEAGPQAAQLAAAGLISPAAAPATAGGAPADAPPAPAAGAAGRSAAAGLHVDPLVGAMTFWLPGGPDPIRADPLPDAMWDDLMARARRERCLGPLTWAVASGALPATEAQRDEAERHAILVARRAVAQERELLEVTAWLAEEDIDVRVLKGSAVAHLDHLDPSFRASADHDLLVRGDAIDRAVARLVTQGYRRELPERRPGFDRRFGKDVTLQQRDRYEIDLHRLPLAGPIGSGLDLDALWANPAAFTIGGRTLHALDASGRYCHAAWSLALTDPAPRLVPALDMVAIHHAHGIDPARLDVLAPAGAGRAAITTAAELARRLLGTVAEGLPPDTDAPTTRREWRALASYPGQGGSKARSLLGGVRALPTTADRLAYLTALTMPSTTYRRARTSQHRDPEWRLALRSATRRFRRSSP